MKRGLSHSPNCYPTSSLPSGHVFSQIFLCATFIGGFFVAVGAIGSGRSGLIMWLRFLAILHAAVFAATSAAMSPVSSKLGPSDKIDALRKQPDQVYPFILRLAPGSTLASVLPPDTDPAGVTDLPLIGGASLPLQVSTALALADRPEVLQVWYLHPELAPFYLRVMTALQYNVKTLEPPALVNLSIGPPPRFWPRKPEPDDPMHAATRAAADAGFIPVMAIGNAGEGPGDRSGLVNPWCIPPWVIAVGAYDGAAGRVAAFSSHGDPANPDTWPDVVAQGVDVIGPFPTNLTKSDQRRRYDESNAAFRAQVAPEKWPLYTLESGTSQAAANVTGAAAQVLHFLSETIRQSQGTSGDLFQLTAPPDRINPTATALPRLTGTVKRMDDGSMVYTYKMDQPWKMVKQLLRDTAISLPGVPPAQGGAGLIDRALINQQFGAHGLAKPMILPSKVVE
ncbi:MAG: S8 family serine peptidase [Nibricoccus sp.]